VHFTGDDAGKSFSLHWWIRGRVLTVSQCTVVTRRSGKKITCRTEWCIYFTCGKYRKLLTKQILNCVVVRMLRHKARYETKLRFMMSFERLFL
jgi:hypothetical protein